MRFKTVSLRHDEIIKAHHSLTMRVLTQDDIAKIGILRDLSGFNFRSCKIAYCKFDGDLDKAKEWLLTHEVL